MKRCQADESCARTYPTLDADLRTLLKTLDNSPAFPLPRVNNGPSKIRVSPGLFAEAFRNFLYSPESAAGAPRLLRELGHTNRPGLGENTVSVRRLLGGERLAAGFFFVGNVYGRYSLPAEEHSCAHRRYVWG